MDLTISALQTMERVYIFNMLDQLNVEFMYATAISAIHHITRLRRKVYKLNFKLQQKVKHMPSTLDGTD